MRSDACGFAVLSASLGGREIAGSEPCSVVCASGEPRSLHEHKLENEVSRILWRSGCAQAVLKARLVSRKLVH